MKKNYLEFFIFLSFLINTLGSTCETVTIYTDANVVAVSSPSLAITDGCPRNKSEMQAKASQSQKEIVKKYMLITFTEICGWGSFISALVSIGDALDFIFYRNLSKRLYIALPLAIVLSKSARLCEELAQQNSK